MHPGRLQLVEPPSVLVEGAQSHLHGAFRLDEPFSRGVIKHGAVVNPSVVVFPSVRVRVEMDQRQGAVFFRVRLEYGIGDEVIAPQGKQPGALRNDPPRVFLYPLRDGLGAARVELAVAVVDHRQPVEGVEAPVVQLGPAQLGGGLPDGPGAEPRAGPVGRGGVKRDPRHGQVNARQLAGVFAPHEAKGAAVSRFAPGAAQGLPVNGLINHSFRHRPGL